MGILDNAIIFAVNAHSGSTRKGTSLPYILHPIEAAAIAATMTEDCEVIAAAVLHDVIEDTDVSIDEIEREFGPRIANYVSAESENKREHLPAADTWHTRKEETILHLCNEKDLNVKIITLGDKLSNIRSIHRDYLSVGDDLWKRFNQPDKSQHGWYYLSLADALSELSHYPAWQEYKHLVEEVFG